MQNSCGIPTNIEAALSRLKALHEGADSIADVVAFGARAVPPLENILFARESSGLYQVRCRAVEALRSLGAFDVLEEFLRESKPADDPVERLGDDVVISSAARAIARRNDEKTFAFLYELAVRRPLNGVIAALASYHRPEAIPILVNALAEDELRPAAESALLSYGSAAGPILSDAANHVRSGDDLSESELRKLRSILSLLGEVRLKPADGHRTRRFMASSDTQVSLLACRAALRSGPESARSEARSTLLGLRSRVSWLERLQIDQYLASAAD